MIYANIEFQAKDGSWRSFTTWAFTSADRLILATMRLLNSDYKGEWRIRVRH